MKQTLAALFFALILPSLSVHAQESALYFPPLAGNTWSELTPEQTGFCAHRIDSLYSFLESTDTKSFILLQDGRIALEKYFGTFTRDSFWYWASAGKSLSAFLVGQAQEEGWLDINDPVSDWLQPGWTTCPPDKEALITVRHQLTMTTGLEDNVPDDNCTSPNCLTYKADAGTRWAYHNAPYHLVHDVLESATGTSLQLFTKTRLLDPTGMKGLWINHIQYGRARDMARYGLLQLANGVWDGDTLLHDMEYFQEMHTPSQDLNKSYGYLWWLNGQESLMMPGVQWVIPGMLVPSAPPDMYAALGKNDQKIHVVPSKKWVIVRQGNSAEVSPVPVVFDRMLWDYLNELTCMSATKENNPNISIETNLLGDSWNISSDIPVKSLEIFSVTGTLTGRQWWPVACPTIRMAAPALPTGYYLLRITLNDGQTVTRKAFKISR